MNETDHGRWSDDVVAYMLGALEPGETAALEQHAEDCERCREEMRWLAPAVQALPDSVQRVEPAPELRARLLAEVRADAPAAAEENVASPGPLGRAAAWLRNLGSGPMGLRPVVGFAAAVMVVLAVGAFAIGGGIDGSDESGGSSTLLYGKAPGVTARMVDEGDSGELHLANVSQLPDDRVLEAWVQRDGDVEAVEALFVPDSDGNASTELPDMEGVEVVMVTAEPKGGSQAPTSSPIVTLPVPQ
ncbi:MAG TPA: anti-sigma factor [Solirubrobacterales bacterium]|jgi:anti-sigma-K factor RskA|nr:anti-sigma factor [Solirubrobacterales bacterium]